jgi:DNA-binding GntR family transcriptional regulator
VGTATDDNRDLLAAIERADPRAAQDVTEELVRKSWQLTRRCLEQDPEKIMRRD